MLDLHPRLMMLAAALEKWQGVFAVLAPDPGPAPAVLVVQLLPIAGEKMIERAVRGQLTQRGPKWEANNVHNTDKC